MLNDLADAAENKDNLQGSANYANNFFSEVLILSSRSLMNIMRTPELFFARLGASVGFGVMLGTLFLFSDSQTAEGLQHRLSYFVFTCAFYYYTSLEALPIFLAEREIFQREFSRGAYRAASYTIASSIVTFPFMAVVATVFTIVTWWLVGLPNIVNVRILHAFLIFKTILLKSIIQTYYCRYFSFIYL